MTAEQWWDLVVRPVLLLAGGGCLVAALGPLAGILAGVGLVLMSAAWSGR